MAQKLASQPELNDAAKAQFSAGVGDLSRGLIEYASMSRDLNEIRKSLASSGKNGGATGSAIYLGKALPGAVKELGQTLKMAVAYAKAGNITLPPAAAEALGQL